MNFSNYRFTLDIQKSKTQASIPVHFGDTGNRFYITLTDGGNPYIISDGCRVDFYAKKPNGQPLINSCIIENNTLVRYDFNKDTASVEGIHKCELRLISEDGRLITTPSFIMVVDERVIYDDDIITEEDQEKILALGVIAKEEERREAEFERWEAEELRVLAEKNRVEAEESRTEAENARKEAETARVLAENARVEAENERGQEIATIKQNIANHEERIGSNEDSISYNTESIGFLESSLYAHSGQISNHEERITGVERYLGGENFVIDDTTAYEKKVPSNACEKAKILSVGGMTYKDKEGKRLVHTKVTSLFSKGINLWNPDVTEIKTGESYDTSAPREFKEGVWYQGLAGGNIWASYNIEDIVFGVNQVSFKVRGSGYSMARAFRCKPNTAYQFVFDYEGEYPSGCACGFYDKGGNWLGYNWNAKNIVTPADCQWITVCLSSDGAPCNCTFSNILFAESNVELPYTPYVGVIDYLQIPQSLQNDSSWGVGTADSYNKIYFVSGKAFYSKPTKCYEFTGEEDLGEYGSTEDFFRCVSNALDDAMHYPNAPLCSHLDYGEHANTFFISSGMSRFSFRLSYDFFRNGESTNAERIEAVRNWLRNEKTNGTPVTVVYPLANPPADTNISPIMSKENIIKVVKGGYMIADNTEENPVPFSMKYLVTYTKEAN